MSIRTRSVRDRSFILWLVSRRTLTPASLTLGTVQTPLGLTRLACARLVCLVPFKGIISYAVRLVGLFVGVLIARIGLCAQEPRNGAYKRYIICV